MATNTISEKMSSVTVVTYPDDVLIQCPRILLVDLNTDQLDIVSKSLTEYNFDDTIVTYIWKNGEDINWLFDKKLKSDLVIFNAESQNQTIVGYFAAQKKSFFMGDLRDLSIINNSRVFDQTNLLEIFYKVISYE